MTYLIELPVSVAGEATDVVKVEIDEVEDGLVTVAGPGRIVARASQSLGAMLAGVRPVAENFVDGFQDMANPPDEMSIEFGLSLSAEADVVISKSSAQANFKVSLTWRAQRSDATSRPGAAH